MITPAAKREMHNVKEPSLSLAPSSEAVKDYITKQNSSIKAMFFWQGRIVAARFFNRILCSRFPKRYIFFYISFFFFTLNLHLAVSYFFPNEKQIF